MKYFFLIFSIFILTSCAAIFNKPYTTVNIHTKSPANVVINNDTMSTVNNMVSYIVSRKKEPLELTSIADSIIKNYQIKSQLSTMFLNNIFIYCGIPGFFIDLLTPKRFTYPEHILINPLNSSLEYRKYLNYNHQGELYWNISIPEINFLHQYTQFAGYVNNKGCMGISTGFDYYYKPQQFVNVTGAIALTYEAPIPLPLEYFGPYERAFTKYLSISNNHRFYFISIGYGLSFSQNNWDYFGWNTGFSRIADIKKQSLGMGFIFPAYIKLGPAFNLGLIYRPSFYRPYTLQPFKYEHLVSVDLAWKILLKK